VRSGDIEAPLMPVIAITNCRKLEDYRQAILHVGGEVRIVDPTMPVEEALAGVGGVLLTGGADILPARYGEATHPSVVDIDLARDEFELALIAQARKRDLPMIGICRGIQALNVASGGTLVQDLPSLVPAASPHMLDVPPHQPFSLAHEVWIEKDSILSDLMRERLVEADTCEVNSRHHQALKAVAANFRVSATAPDGVIEAIEDPSLRFCLGVQWHPENFWRTGEFRPLFEGFLEAASKSALT
jgi:putative glutamine amidotransferase